MSHVLGYARVSTDDQDFAGQRQRLQAIGALRIFEDVVSGKTFERPGLSELLDYIRPGDTLAVVRLDRLGRSPLSVRFGTDSTMTPVRRRHLAAKPLLFCSPNRET